VPSQKFSNEEKEQDNKTFILLGSDEKNEDEFRAFGIVGDINEEKAAEAIYSLMHFHRSRMSEELSDPNDPNSEVVQTIQPMELVLSTHGGSAEEMFAIYDVMRNVKKDCDIITRGLGKVMSAGVLLLAAGTKGQREIGRYCRIMIHSAVGGYAGSLHNLENEMEEVRYIQEQYVKALVDETKMTSKQLKKMLEKKVNIYLSADEAVKLGIADLII
jgi:ATP-dependent Clp endopeptidase proteolytic subunit ClpP